MKYSVVVLTREPKENIEYLCRYWEPNNGFLLLHQALSAKDYYHGGPPPEAGDRMVVIPGDNIIVVTSRLLASHE